MGHIRDQRGQYSLVRVSGAMKKHHDKSKLWMVGVIWLTFPHCSPSLKEVRTGQKRGRQRPWRSAVYVGLLSLLSYKTQDH